MPASPGSKGKKMGKKIGISSHIFAEEELTPDHLELIAREGFSLIELYANKPHFDFDEKGKIKEIARTINSLGLTVNSVHAPFFAHLEEARAGRYFSIASPDEEERRKAVSFISCALRNISSFVQFRFLVVHQGASGEPYRSPFIEQAKKSLSELYPDCERFGVTIALENIDSELSSPESLASFIKNNEGAPLAACLDFAHAYLFSGLLEAMEALSSYIATSHIHDTFGEEDDHLPPFSGRIDWEGSFRKLKEVGYKGPLILEPRGGDDPEEVLRESAKSREKITSLIS
jgi:sugar phosphate isomerase/epimerase